MFENKFFPSQNNQETAPLLILFGFVGSNERVMNKYRECWKGFNVFLFTPPCDMTIYLMRVGGRIFNKKLNKYFKDNPNVNKTVYIHGLSIGASFVSGFLKMLELDENGEYRYILPYIKGIVMDSGLVITPNDAITGFKSAIREQAGSIGKIIQHAVPMFTPFINYFCKHDVPYLFKNHYHFLVIFSENDTYFPGASENLVDRLNNTDKKSNYKDRIIIEKKFMSNHIEHLKNNREEYMDSIVNFINITTSNKKF
ncbi:hypothetical protein RB653_004507 [Dictyostelium firmibasis]|uniref:Uncharacterized protein n=1 Tax=Dictyostelium firmibasis TaxID=79012 RepID=A0AAN7UJG3_9MYCE